MELAIRRDLQRHAVVVLVAVPPGGNRADPVGELEPEPFLEEALGRAQPPRLEGHVFEPARKRALGVGRGRVHLLHAVEELEPMAGRAGDERAAGNARLRGGGTEALTAGLDGAGHRGLERVGVLHLEGDVVVTALRPLDQDQFVVAVVAGQVGTSALPQRLLELKDGGVEGHRLVEVLDPEGHVTDSRNHAKTVYSPLP